ncbi:translation elongation regulator Gcn1 [Schizosaccharomyces japonicus yFS275]|uniref:Translation elongation regulator Gcn1 n=1 Tax=Schizosaccharomyces japonicus (strain yFS275 / FY16936) TaxID=402676 RepID=B6JZI6_SCHJY|nr:translation elongation regulator Gcn1 [Schizosaccharomyces japonicus yFS275]EEB06954.2 translation elongation regulator Gcn1 [Schizosaccharomyces japonicus yFS275]
MQAEDSTESVTSGAESLRLSNVVKTREMLLSFTGSSEKILNYIRVVDSTHEFDNELIECILKFYAETLHRTLPRRVRVAIVRSLKHLVNCTAHTVKCLASFIMKTVVRAERAHYPPGFLLTTLSWLNDVVMSTCTSAEVCESLVKNLCPIQAKLLFMCLSSTKHTLANSALRSTRRCIRSLLLTNSKNYESFVDKFFEALLPTLPMPNGLAFVGEFLSCCYYFKLSKGPLEALGKHKQTIATLLVKQVFAAKGIMPVALYAEFTRGYGLVSSLDDFSSLVLPSLEKTLLRSPEVVFAGVITHLTSGFATAGKDLSSVLLQKITPAFISGFKSSNATTRQNACATFTACAKLAKNQEVADHAVEELLKVLRTGKLIPLFQKEQAEPLKVLGAVLMKNLETGLLNNVLPDETVLKSLRSFLKDARAPIREYWILSIARLLWNFETFSAAQTSVLELFLHELLDLCKEALKNLSNAAQSGSIMAPFVLLAFVFSHVPKTAPEVAESEQFKHIQAFLRNALNPKSKEMLLFTQRNINRLLDAQQKQWAIIAACIYITEFAESLDNSAYADLFYCLVFTLQAKSNDKESCFSALKELSRTCPEARVKLSEQMWDWRLLTEKLREQKKAEVVFYENSVSYFFTLLSAFTLDYEAMQPSDKQAYDEYLLALLFLSYYYKSKIDWIRLCQNAKRDPSALVSSNLEKLFRNYELVLAESGNELKTNAVISSLEMVAFVAPDDAIPHIVKLFRSQLENIRFDNITDTDIAIWKTPEGTMYHNVLEKQTKLQKNTKDYETKKWEAEMRANLAKKKPVSLTKEQKQAVEEQLRVEGDIRKKVTNVVSSFTHSMFIIRSLAASVQLRPDLWIEDAINCLLFGNIYQESLRFSGTLASETLLCCIKASSLEERIGEANFALKLLKSLSQVLGYEKSLDNSADLVTNVLHKLRFCIEVHGFSTPMFACVFPLLYRLVQKEFNAKTEDERDEQILLVTETLIMQAPTAHELYAMRCKYLESLLHLVAAVPSQYHEVRDAMISFAQSISSEYTEEELQLLLSKVCASDSSLRTAVLQTLQCLDLHRFDFIKEIFLELYDDTDANASLAHDISKSNTFEADESSLKELLPFLDNESAYVHEILGKALCDLIDDYEEFSTSIPRELMSNYRVKALPTPPEYDEYGIIVKDTIGRDLGRSSREAIATCFAHVVKVMASNILIEFLEFLLTATEVDSQIPVTDVSVTVASTMLEAGKVAIELHGKHQVESLMSFFEESLQRVDSSSSFDDRLREAMIVLFGTVAKHLSSSDTRLVVVIDSLIATLSTPSESVQLAVANCLPPLIKKYSDKNEDYMKKLTETLLSSSSFAEKKGAAYGLAGLTKGVGIKAFKDFGIMDTLKEALEDKKNKDRRQGALFAIESFSHILGVFFEPYVPEIIPLLISTFGDSSTEVRDATSDAAKAIMSHLSGYGVKLILPSLLDGLNEYNWRSKFASVEMLGLMSYMAPKQLSYSLPTIIPRLTDVLTDSHNQVRNAANKSLTRFGDVISNPEIQTLVPVLLKALSDPTIHTEEALSALVKTPFVHYIDPPSLALVVPIVYYGLNERVAAVKKQSAKIFGLMASLTDPSDLSVHLEKLVPRLREVLIDPVPDTRATAAKALGSLVEKLGETNFPSIIPELLSILKSDASEVDRQGAAQGLSEILAGLGLARLDDVFPDILANTSNGNPSIRESFISLLIYLPATFGARFQPYLARAIPPILNGLADESDFVQSASLRAARMIINNYASKSVDLLLPELEKGLFDNYWRIRVSSVQLVGDLIFKLAGINKKSVEEEQQEEEENVTASDVKRKALIEAIGNDRHDRIMSALFIVRQDVSALVRAPASQIWKAVVVNTPRTVKEIMPTLTSMIISNLNSSGNDRRVMCVKTLGELIRKIGFDVMEQLLPSLENGRLSTNPQDRIGVCIAITELINSCAPEQLENYASTITNAIRGALVDSDASVRSVAAEAFDSLQNAIGNKAIDEVLPELLILLQSDEKSEFALSALQEIITRRSTSIFPVLIPTLIKQPISAFNARALASLATAAGATLLRRLPSILTALMESTFSASEGDLEGLTSATDSIMVSVQDPEGITQMMAYFTNLATNEDYRKRAFACSRMAAYFKDSKVELGKFYAEWVRVFIGLYEDRSEDVVKAALAAQTALVGSLRKDQMEPLVLPLCKALSDVGVPDTALPAFQLPRAINSVLPILLQGLMYGSTEQREKSALGIADIVRRTEPTALRPSVTQITGPLIRIIGERFPTDVKSAILFTLNILLTKIPTFLRPFLPQLQRTFAKCLADPSSDVVRNRAAAALGTLITLQTRVDPLITELVSGSRSSDAGVRKAMFKALFEVVSKSGKNMSENSMNSVGDLLEETEASDMTDVVNMAKLYGAWFANLPDARASEFLEDKLFSVEEDTTLRVLILNAVVRFGFEKIISSGSESAVAEYISRLCANSDPFISENAVKAAGKYLLTEMNQNFNDAKRLIESLAECIQAPVSGSNDCKRLALVVLHTVANSNFDVVRAHLPTLVPAVFGCVRATVIPVKLAAETTFLSLLQLRENEAFAEKFISTLQTPRARSISDYTRRVAFKLAAAERDRIASGSGRIQIEEAENLAEINAIGADDGMFSQQDA